MAGYFIKVANEKKEGRWKRRKRREVEGGEVEEGETEKEK